MKYIKKPVEIEAIQYNGDNHNLQECINFLGYDNYYTVWNGDGERTLFIKTLEGDMKVSLGDYIIKGVYNKKSKVYQLLKEWLKEEE